VHPDDRDRVQKEIKDAVEGRREHHVQYRLLLKDGSIRWVEGRGQLVRNRDGKPVAMLGVCSDITQTRLAQEERERLLERERTARSEAERANRSKDNFLAVLSHELRTPLTPVLLTTSLLENDANLPDSIRGDIQMIRRNVEMEARLIDDLLDMTRITRGKLQLNLQTTDLHEIVLRAIDICCRGTNINLKVELNAKRHHIRADAGRIQQVLWNLLNNARKFTPAGGTISVRSGNRDEKTIQVEVTDTGVGIPADILPKLFLAFEQGDSAEAKRAGGLGLGLAISKALVHGHGGILRATSEGQGRGSTFAVEFATVPPPPAQPPNGRARPHAGQKRARILLVEDNEVTLKVLRRLLQSREHHVVEATSIATAKEAAAREPVDLVISDLGLPDGLGHEVMRELGKLYGVRGIAISGYGMPADIDQSRKAGFVEHLVKPIDAAALEAAIARALQVETPVRT
jgi:signal transduction histidine kinase/ActR/RegA family two-component response regulator